MKIDWGWFQLVTGRDAALAETPDEQPLQLLVTLPPAERARIYGAMAPYEGMDAPRMLRNALTLFLMAAAGELRDKRGRKVVLGKLRDEWTDAGE